MDDELPKEIEEENIKLTPKQRVFIKEFQDNGGVATQAALKAYDTDNYSTAATIANENMNKPEVKRAIEVIMEKQGLTDDYLIEHTKKVIESDDPNAKAKGIKLAGDMKGVWAPKEHKTEQSGEMVVRWATPEEKLEEEDED